MDKKIAEICIEKLDLVIRELRKYEETERLQDLVGIVSCALLEEYFKYSRKRKNEH